MANYKETQLQATQARGNWLKYALLYNPVTVSPHLWKRSER